MTNAATKALADALTRLLEWPNPQGTIEQAYIPRWLADECRAALSADPVAAEPPRALPETMSRDEMLKYYSSYSNLCAHEALKYQKRIRDLESATQPVAVGGREPLTPRQYNMTLSMVPNVPPSAYEDATRAIEAAHGIHPTPKAGESS